jgi:hypothetical protein
MYSYVLNKILKGFKHVPTEILLIILLGKETNEIQNLIPSLIARMFYLSSDTRYGLLVSRSI